MTPTRPRAALRFAPLALLASFGLFWFSDTVADPDLWGHLRFGRDMLQSRAIIQNDTYSYRTAGQRWINHEWLSEALLAAIYDRWGPPGLIGCKTVHCLSILGLSHRHLRSRGLPAVRSLLLLVLLSIPLHMGLGTIRPQMFTYIFILIELLLLESTAPG